MKSLIIIFVIIFTIIGSYYIVNNLLAENTYAMSTFLDSTSQYIVKNDWNSAIKEFDKLEDKWIDYRTKWTLILDHHEIDNIDLSVARANKYIENKSKPLSLAELEVLKSLVNIVKESESLTIPNIF